MNKATRCAIYTRKSSEEGLDQAFNSLHAQREACEAYVKSQAAEGWRALPTIYDDGGFSGGNMERPGLEALLADVDAGRIDTVVVYKVDRLTRSLGDFARIVDRLDAAGASFVSVTQAFNTTSSMGRLTLNVLLSFAQFEREVTGERIRDKIAASKSKGMWMGGNLPLGYDVPTDLTTRALVVNEAEADTVRHIFRTYLELGSGHALVARLSAEGVRSKVRETRAGKLIGGNHLCRGALFHLLQNRTYLGEIPHGEKTYPGAHPAIVDAALFDAVQATIASHRRQYVARPTRAAAMPLRGRIFDADGLPMSPAFTHGREGKVYRYYVSAPLQQGRAVRPDPNAIRRVAASEIEDLVARDMRLRLRAQDDADLSSLLVSVKRVELEAQAVRIVLVRSSLPRWAVAECDLHPTDETLVVATLNIRCRMRGGRTFITGPAGVEAVRRSRRDPKLIAGLQQGHRAALAMGWRSADGSITQAQMSAPAYAYDRSLCRLAFLAPDIQRSIMEGRQPVAVNLALLLEEDIPASWPAQRAKFGFPTR